MYPKDIRDCRKPPGQGGLVLDDLRKVAQEMGVKNTKDMNRKQLCDEIEKNLTKTKAKAPKAKTKAKSPKVKAKSPKVKAKSPKAKAKTPQKTEFGFLPSDDEKGKIGTLIKKLPQIRKKAGDGTFIAYIGKKNLDDLPKLLETHKELKPVKQQGYGWYIWSYTPEGVERAIDKIINEEEKWEAAQEAYRASFSQIIIASDDEEPVHIVITEEEFPTLGPKATTKKVAVGTWGQPLKIIYPEPKKTKVDLLREPPLPRIEAPKQLQLLAPREEEDTEEEFYTDTEEELFFDSDEDIIEEDTDFEEY